MTATNQSSICLSFKTDSLSTSTEPKPYMSSRHWTEAPAADALRLTLDTRTRCPIQALVELRRVIRFRLFYQLQGPDQWRLWPDVTVRSKVRSKSGHVSLDERLSRAMMQQQLLRRRKAACLAHALWLLAQGLGRHVAPLCLSKQHNTGFVCPHRRLIAPDSPTPSLPPEPYILYPEP